MGKRVLVADDSATIQKAFAMVFGGQDVSLIAARTLDEAISAARQGRPDLVIADTNLAGRTGYELCAAVKSDAGLRGIPVFILASTHSPYDESKGREVGADGHLMKPFESQGIIDKVNEILARAPAGAAKPAAVVPAAVAPAAAPVAPPAPAAPPRAAAPMTASVSPLRGRADHAQIEDDDDYEVTIERTPLVVPTPPAARPAPAAPLPVAASAAPAAAPPAPTGSPPYSGMGLRPSLIPGARPGIPVRPAAVSTLAASTLAAPGSAAAAPAAGGPGFGLRPGTSPGAPAAGGSPAPANTGAGAPMSPVSGLAAGPAPSAPANVGRTMMGMPAVVIPGVPRAGGAPQSTGPLPTPGMAPARPTAFSPGTAPQSPAPPPPAAPPPAGPPALHLASVAPQAANQTSQSMEAHVGATVSARVEQKLSAFAARGPEYEAIAKLSREVIEEIVWEVVPELAEIIIREHVERLGIAKKLG
jgi:CheY-like chemotaxis protein